MNLPTFHVNESAVSTYELGLWVLAFVFVSEKVNAVSLQ